MRGALVRGYHRLQKRVHRPSGLQRGLESAEWTARFKSSEGKFLMAVLKNQIPVRSENG
jgi:hypothetical protein